MSAPETILFISVCIPRRMIAWLGELKKKVV
jgi:hypothetical protein